MVAAYGWVRPKVGGVFVALFPVVLTSMMLILHRGHGAQPTAAVLADSALGPDAVRPGHSGLARRGGIHLGSAIGLGLALATCVSGGIWALWWNGRREGRRNPTAPFMRVTTRRVEDDHPAPRDS